MKRKILSVLCVVLFVWASAEPCDDHYYQCESDREEVIEDIANNCPSGELGLEITWLDC